MPNLATLLTNSAARSAGRVAVQFDGLHLTYEALDVATAQVAAGRPGVPRDEQRSLQSVHKRRPSN